MVSVEKWKHHFKTLSNEMHPIDSTYVVKGHGRGIGRNGFSKSIMYKLRQPPATSPKIDIVSPVAQTIDQARERIKNEKGNKKSTTRKKTNIRGKVAKKRTTSPNKRKKKTVPKKIKKLEKKKKK